MPITQWSKLCMLYQNVTDCSMWYIRIATTCSNPSIKITKDYWVVYRPWFLTIRYSLEIPYKCTSPRGPVVSLKWSYECKWWNVWCEGRLVTPPQYQHLIIYQTTVRRNRHIIEHHCTRSNAHRVLYEVLCVTNDNTNGLFHNSNYLAHKQNRFP